MKNTNGSRFILRFCGVIFYRQASLTYCVEKTFVVVCGFKIARRAKKNGVFMMRSLKLITAADLFGMVAIAALLTLVGCGGSTPATTATAATTTSTTTTAASAVTATITLALVDSAASAVTSISSGSPGTLKATLKDLNGVAIPNTVVTFKPTDATLVTMTPTNGTALTSTAGVASIQLSPASSSVSGATTISASAQVSTTAVTASTGLSIGATTVSMTAPSFGSATLSAFGTTSVSVTVSTNGVAVTTPQTVNFSSSCASNSKASLSTGISTVNGVATASYRDIGCAGTDTISASVAGGLATSSATLTVTAPAVGSIQYISATPTNISLKGSGGAPSSLVTFKVLDAGGNPISGKTVTLGLSTAVGGLSLASNSGISDAGGLVIATVNSGTISTPVRVTASTPGAVTGSTLTTQSSQLSITTGIPDQTGFSLSAAQHNIEGLSIDGITTVLTARLADHFKNPVPDGTTVNFTAETGSIVGTCNTAAGSCSATMTTQGTRPTNGRVSVLAYAIGEETFTDLNGNGVADLLPTNEMIDVNGASTDLPEAFVDFNENGIRDAATEPFIDYNQDGLYTAADGKYSGVLCDNTVSLAAVTPCATAKTLHVRNSQVIVFSGSAAGITINAGGVVALPVCTAAGGIGAPSTFTVTVVDVNGNAMPVGSTVAFTTSNGTLVSGASYVIPDTIGCRTGFAGCPASAASATFGNIAVTLKSDATWAAPVAPAVVGTCTNTNGATGTFSVTVTSPKGLVTTQTATVTD